MFLPLQFSVVRVEVVVVIIIIGYGEV